jgi:hypothetical protein
MTSDDPTLPAGEPPPRPLSLIAFTLFASYCLGANAAVALHELGHALGGWLAGGKILGLYLNPQGYAGSYAARDLSAGFTVAHGYLLLVAGGPAFGAAFGVILLTAASLLKRGTLGWIVAHGSGTWCIGNNGAYLLLGSLYPFGDALFLSELGVPRWSLFLAGLPLVVAFLALFASFLRGIGLQPRDTYARWVLAVEAGLLGYLLLILLWRLIRPPNAPIPVTGNDLLGMACSPVLLLLLASCTYPFRRTTLGPEPPPSEPHWAKAGVVFGLGVLFMAAEVVFFNYDYEAAAAAARG